MNAIDLTLQLAQVDIGIALRGRAAAALPLLRNWFDGFLSTTDSGRCRVRVDVFDLHRASPAFRRRLNEPVVEALLPVAELLNELPSSVIGPSRAQTTTAARCLDGLLLFDSVTAAGRIWLTHPGNGCFRPLHRLLWMYLAMALGESQRCFVHCAAVERRGTAYLFWGDSGAGKSTVAGLLKDGRILSDDGPILAHGDDQCVVYPSPFRQSSEPGGNRCCESGAPGRIGGLYLLAQDRRLFLETVSRRRAFAEILRRHVHFFDYLSANARKTIFEMLYALVTSAPVHRLHFPLQADLWPLLLSRPADLNHAGFC